MEKIKIGLLTGGFFEFWRMYSELEKIVEDEMRGLYQRIEKRLRDRYDVVWSGLADTLEKCDAAGQKFKDEDIDLLVICEGSYFPDFMPIQTTEYLRGVPVLILLTQPQPYVPLDMNYKDAIHHSFGMVGVVQLTGAFKKMGRDFELIVSSLDDETLPDQVAKYAKVVAVYKKLRFLNLGIVGHTFQGMYDLELDKTLFKGTIGPNVIYIELHELMSIWEEISSEAGDSVASELRELYQLDGPGDEDINKACRLGLALEELAEKHGLDGISHLCQHFLHVQTETTPCYANARLVEKGIMVTCEGDIGNLASMCILHELTGEPAFHGEFGMYDLKENALLFVHHGAGNPRLARDPAEINLTSTGEKWGFTGEGASFRYVGKPGRVTLASLIYDREGWKMLITGGEVIDVPLRPYFGAQFTIQVDRPIKEYVENLCREGVTHHAALVYGDVQSELAKLANLLKIRKFLL
jgi:L-arabinose isomerase